jgi:hypothetical protein
MAILIAQKNTFEQHHLCEGFVMAEIGEREPITLNKLWPREHPKFSIWLAENIGYLSKALGITLIVTHDPQLGGNVYNEPFYFDILAKDDDGNTVVIENQYGETDHKHLGQVITYLSHLDAKRAIWVVETARPEYKKAINWLNEATPNDTKFYLVALKAHRSGDSLPALAFEVESGPSEEAKGWIQKEFFLDFSPESRNETPL